MGSTNFKKIHKGSELEKRLSINYHQHSIPLLCYPQLLRSRNLGQVDIAYLSIFSSSMTLYLVEVKSSRGISSPQKRRLQHSGYFLAQLLRMPALFFCYSEEKQE
jgi:hypothetical protein